MRWENERESDNVEDRRGTGIPTGAKIGGIGGIGLVAVVLLGMLFGVDPSTILRSVSTTQPQTRPAPMPQKTTPAQDAQRKFVAVILASTEDVWADTFKKMGKTYQPPKLVLFSGGVQSACGIAGSAMGPFYCPGDRKVYLDFSFFEDMQRKLGVSGEFARAYVIAHEVGHHVQNLMGIMPKVQQLQARAAPTDRYKLSVMLELQADCFAGAWAKQADIRRNILEPGTSKKVLT